MPRPPSSLLTSSRAHLRAMRGGLSSGGERDPPGKPRPETAHLPQLAIGRLGSQEVARAPRCTVRRRPVRTSSFTRMCSDGCAAAETWCAFEGEEVRECCGCGSPAGRWGGSMPHRRRRLCCVSNMPAVRIAVRSSTLSAIAGRSANRCCVAAWRRADLPSSSGRGSTGRNLDGCPSLVIPLGGDVSPQSDALFSLEPY